MMNQVALWWNIGHTSNNQDRRLVGRVSPGGGWKKFIETRVIPGVEWSQPHLPKIVLHNPFGAESGKKMQFAQYLYAKKQTPWLVEDFVESWSHFRDQYPKIHVYCYLGGPHNDPCITNLYDTEPLKYLELVKQISEPLLEAGLGIGIDNSVKPRGSVTFGTYFLLKSLFEAQGLKILAEATPELNETDWFNEDYLILESNFHKRHQPGRNINARRKFPEYIKGNKAFIQAGRPTYTGEIMRLIRPGDMDDLQAYKDKILFILSDGHTALFNPDALLKSSLLHV